MAGETVVEITSGASGTGKSYCRVGKWIVEEWIPDYEGVVWTNVNLGRVPDDHSFPPKPWRDAQGYTRTRESFIRRMCNYSAKKLGGKPVDYAKRIRRIPPSVYNAWRDGNSGPWDYFRGVDIDGAHIQIDEIHVFCPVGGNHKRPQQWQNWLGEIRHEGATIEFMTQNIKKLNRKLYDEAAVRRTLHSWGQSRDPYFRIPVTDWYELIAAFMTGKYQIPTVETERTRSDEGFRVNHRGTFKLESKYFQFFNSFQQSNHGGKSGTKKKRQWERRSKLGLLGWFFRKYWPRLTGRFAIVLLIVWVCFFGGGTLALEAWLGAMKYAMKKNSTAAQAEIIEPTIEAVQEPAIETQPVPIVHEQVQPIYQPVSITPEDLTDEPAELLVTEREDELQAEIDRLTLEIERQGIAAADIEAQRREASALVMVTPNQVTFREGYTYHLGDLVDYGQWAGRRITAINYARRSVILDDEIILRMGRDDGRVGGVPGEADPAESDAGPNLPRPLSSRSE